MTHRSMTALPMTALFALLSAPLFVSSCGSSSNPPPPECAALMNYSATTLTPISFATDIMPILMDTGSIPPTTPGCSTAAICHNGASPVNLSNGGTKTLSFTDTPANVLAALEMPSVNAPSMQRVAAGSVANSFMAYKLSGATGLSCVNAKCVSGASIGNSKPCGDPMPTSTSGMLNAAQVTKILDWIAQGANP